MRRRKQSGAVCLITEAKCRTAVQALGLVKHDSWSRYLRLYWMCARTCLIRAMTFRGNFRIRCGTHIIWIGLQVAFFQVIFLHTERIGDWDKHRYLFFLGTFLTLNGLVNCLFIGNCTQFSELVRTGNLDYVLLKPIDEQFLISCQRVDWAMIPEILFSVGLTLYFDYKAFLKCICVESDEVLSPRHVTPSDGSGTRRAVG